MAANIEQIFQDFILNKIREIEDQNEDKATAEGAGAGIEMQLFPERAVEERAKRGDVRDGGSQKKHKKHHKHKSKKKKRRKHREKESGSESGADLEKGTKHQPRRGTSEEANKEQGEGDESKSRCLKRHSTGKRRKRKKKKKEDEEEERRRWRRRKGKGEEENSSGSDSEFAAKQRDGQSDERLLPRRREELPDIIPKQDSSNKGRGAEERRGSRSRRSRSRSRSRFRSRSRSACRRSGTCSRSSSQRYRTRSSSSEKRGVPEEPARSTRGPPDDLQPPQASSAGRAEELLGSHAGPDWGGRPAGNAEAATQRTPGPGPSRSASPERDKTLADPGEFPRLRASEPPRSPGAGVRTPAKTTRRPSASPRSKRGAKRRKRSRSPCRRRRTGSRSRSCSKRKRSRSRSGGRRLRRSRSRSRSLSRERRRAAYSQRDRWKREPSHSPVLILRKNRSPGSPQRLSELDKNQLLEIAKANAAAMCAKAGMPIPAGLRSTMLPLALPSMAMNAAMASMTAATVTAALSNMGTLSSLHPLPSATHRPAPTLQPAPPAGAAALEEVKRKVVKQANSIGIKEFTDKCKMIVDSKGELPVAMPHVSDEEDEQKPFGGSAVREQKAISFSINNTTVRPAARSDAGMAKEFPVSSGCQHRKKEGEVLGAYGEWVPVDNTAEKAAAASRKSLAAVLVPALPAAVAASGAASSSSERAPAAGLPEVVEQVAFAPDKDSVFPDPALQPVDISQAVSERLKAQRRLAENPYDVSAICMLSRAQEQVDAWAQSNTVPGLFTGSTGAQVLSSEELSTGGPQAWLKKDQFLRAAPVCGGVGEFLMRKMGWKTGEGLGRNREGTVEPIVIDFKVDRKGLVAEGEKPQKQTGGLVVTKDLMGKHPVSALIELCNKKRIVQPDFAMVHHSGPDHRKNFLFKVTVNGVDYQPQTASPNKKHAKAMAATVALQALGEVPVDGPGLYTGPVFTAASTGPLFST